MTLTLDPAATSVSASRAGPGQPRTQAQAATPRAGSSPSTAVSSAPVGADVAASTAVSDGLARGASIADTAQAAASSVLQILQQMKETAAGVASGAQPPSAASGDFRTLVDQLRATIQSASASGVNLIDGSATPGVQVGADATGAQATLTAYDLKPGGGTVALSDDASVHTATAAAVTLGQVQSSLEATSGVLTNLATQAKQISAHADFVATLGAASGARGSDGADGARLQALQLRQGLHEQAGGIANAAPQAVLALFRS